MLDETTAQQEIAALETATETFTSSSNSYQMPANQVVAEFGEVNVERYEQNCHVNFTIAMEPQGRLAEGWRTGLALDASASMKRSYGRKVEARVDPALLTTYIKQGRLKSYLEDGEPVRRIEREAFAEMQQQGYEINYTTNILQPLVQDLTAYLAGSLDSIGQTALIYWGCGNGEEIQVLGEFTAESCQELAITGPATFKLGKSTKLLPAIAYFTKQYPQATRGMYIFLTDGRIDDINQVKSYTRLIAQEIAQGQRNYLKLILIGIGNDVDRYQLQELDDFDAGVNVDIWDYKIADEMSSLTQIFAEVVNDNQIIAESGSIYDDRGNCIKSYPLGLPARVDFDIHRDAEWFELEVGQQRIRQGLVLGAAIAPLPKKQLLDFELQAIASQQAIANEPVSTAAEVEQDSPPPTISKFQKFLAAIFLGAAFVGIAIAFAILIKRSDESSQSPIPIPKTNLTNSTNPQSPITTPKTNLTNPTNSPSPTTTPKPNPTNSPNSPSPITPPKPNLTNSTNPQSPITTPKPNLTNPTNPHSPTTTPKPNLTNSTNPQSPIPNPQLPITNPDEETVVFFAADEITVAPEEQIKIDEFWQKIQGRKGIIQVSGHTDKSGDYAYNLDLSKDRADEVVRLLRDRGLNDNYKVTFEALSWLQPKQGKANSNSAASNRRVVIQFKETK
ncbi:MAG: OmpA family protein [Pseudanabaenaceae cyanobacterium bins.39]|nr:OmpA family protein [Pseudanabaenaceae cyanobacterium bins.39]